MYPQVRRAVLPITPSSKPAHHMSRLAFSAWKIPPPEFPHVPRNQIGRLGARSFRPPTLCCASARTLLSRQYALATSHLHFLTGRLANNKTKSRVPAIVSGLLVATWLACHEFALLRDNHVLVDCGCTLRGQLVWAFGGPCVPAMRQGSEGSCACLRFARAGGGRGGEESRGCFHTLRST